MFHRFSILAIAGMIAAPAFAADAGVADYPRFSLSGFGTVGAAHSSESQADFTSTIFKPNGAGYSHDWSFDVDSRLGVQLNVDVTSNLSGVVQVVVEQSPDGAYHPKTEWANLKYQLTPDLSVRVGRIAVPGFMASEYRKVGYAVPWVRPPIDVYSLASVSSNDGVDVSYRFHGKDWTNTVQAYLGQRDIDSGDGYVTKTRDSVGLSNTFDLDPFSLRFSYQRGITASDGSAPLFTAFRQFGPTGNAIADRYDLHLKPYRLISVGASYDRGNWLLTGEWARMRTDGWIGNGTGWYLGGGYRVGLFTPYLIRSRARLDSPHSEAGLPTAGLPPQMAIPAMQLNGALNSMLGILVPDQDTVAVGMRWDFARNTALKLQYDRIDLSPGSGNGLRNRQPGFKPGGALNVFSVTLDFVF
jgi:hypothetical protein